VNLIVSTFNKRTLAELPYTDIEIIERNGELVVTNHNTGPVNHITVPVKRNKNYTVIGRKDGFTPDSLTFSTYGITQSVDIDKKLYLDPADVVLQVRTFDARQRLPLPGTTVEVVDKDGGFHGRKVDERSHIQYFGIPPVNTYTVTGTRKGYRKATATIQESDFNKDTIVVDLYLELGNLEDFLPLAIYFDNDVPDPKSQRGTTTKRYLETYTPYYDSKEQFKRRYARTGDRDEEERLLADVEVFFEDSLRVNKEEFESFLNILHQYLDEGLSFKIFLKGYTSPLASDAYNYQLGQRRINSIQNEFAAFRNGVLKKYFDSGDLAVTEKSFGEETAPPTVSDDPRDTRRSIYSPEASIERRVEIIEIENPN
jgi:outer membrane protein OmpA-like peptidoglycan-associated protein